jgi:hypothetical protein
MRHEISKRGSEVHGLTRDYYIKKNYTPLAQNLIGDYRKYFKSL